MQSLIQRSIRPFGRSVQISAFRSFSKGPPPPITLSTNMLSRVSQNLLNDIDLIVYDMAGTTVQEGGLVYQTLRRCMEDDGLKVTEAEMHAWHGAKKEAVIEHFALKSGTPESELEERVVRIGDTFVNSIEEAYFAEASPIAHVEDGLIGYFKRLQKAGIKIAFDTGYPPNIQQGLIDKLGFDKIVDAYVSSYQVAEGRPFPYMIYHLMEKTGTCDVRRVCKVGDSVRDIEEGRNAGCGLVVGVLSGADTFDDLMGAGADLVCDVATDLPVPRKSAGVSYRLPDLS